MEFSPYIGWNESGGWRVVYPCAADYTTKDLEGSEPDMRSEDELEIQKMWRRSYGES